MKKLIFIALLALISFSCRTIKQTTTTKTDVKTAANLDVKQSNESKLEVDSSQLVVDNSVTNSLISEDITVTQLSKPDSAGRQFTTQTTVIHRVTDNDRYAHVNTATKVNTSKQNKTMLSDKSDYKSDDKSQLVTTKETKMSAWVYVGIFVLLCIIGVLAYLIFKRFGFIK